LYCIIISTMIGKMIKTITIYYFIFAAQKSN
jgi:hypothetical protein